MDDNKRLDFQSYTDLVVAAIAAGLDFGKALTLVTAYLYYWHNGPPTLVHPGMLMHYDIEGLKSSPQGEEAQ